MLFFSCIYFVVCNAFDLAKLMISRVWQRLKAGSTFCYPRLTEDSTDAVSQGQLHTGTNNSSKGETLQDIPLYDEKTDTGRYKFRI